jgi:pyruvate ferredoxin oxidoreductase delta subunit
MNGWNNFEMGGVVFSFKEEFDKTVETQPENRPYSENNSYTNTVADWRVDKPVYNSEHCIHCQFCWIYCPDMSIISRDKKMVGVDYQHCKGCGICADVCPTNPKSLLMFMERVDNEEALAGWPEKEDKKKKDS